MLQPTRLFLLALIAATAIGIAGSRLVSAQQQAIKRTDLLKSELRDIQEIHGAVLQRKQIIGAE